MDKTCKSCKWWSAKKDDPYYANTTTLNAKFCTSPKIRFATTKGVKNNAKELWEHDEILIDDKDESPIPPDGAGLLDGSGYFACIMTGPDFGCVNHEIS